MKFLLFSLSSFYLFSTHNFLVFVFHFLLVRSNFLISLIICWRDDKSLRLLYNVRIKSSWVYSAENRFVGFFIITWAPGLKIKRENGAFLMSYCGFDKQLKIVNFCQMCFSFRAQFFSFETLEACRDWSAILKVHLNQKLMQTPTFNSSFLQSSEQGGPKVGQKSFYLNFVNRTIKPLDKYEDCKKNRLTFFLLLRDTAWLIRNCCAAQFPLCSSEPVEGP